MRKGGEAEMAEGSKGLDRLAEGKVVEKGKVGCVAG